MATVQNRTVYVTNTNQPVYRPQPVQGQPMAVCCSVGMIMFGVFFCFPGIILTATGASIVAGPLLLSLGIVLVIIGVVMCRKNQQAGLTGNVIGGQVVTTTVQQPYVVQQGGVAQNVNMQTNVHPTTTIYHAGQPQVTTTFQHQQGAQVPMPAPQGQGYPEPQITASYPPTNPAAAPGYAPNNPDFATPGYPPTNPSYPPQGFSPAPPAYNDVVDTK
uniref:DNA-directed RNA polymerase II subunit RPB1-like n=1 Tax=Phallusia mammillata TaxID=59560 RepID=A0A6F9DNM0_9ASCI|nr:DNA-directed RNA polymerase II subunit RPB1-like [Phallusia mammillata]